MTYYENILSDTNGFKFLIMNLERLIVQHKIVTPADIVMIELCGFLYLIHLTVL